MIYAAAYCRVSTDKEDQANSFETQKAYFERYINQTPQWKCAGIYADEGLSGTSTKKRKAFNRMIADAKAGYFSMIITKEVSRFARNTLDTIKYTRELKEYGVGVFFMNDNINTLDPDAELRLTIMSSIAQEESRKTSERVKWGQKRRMEQGVVFGRNLLGYDVSDGKLLINESGADIVRLIFHKFLEEDKSTYTISKELRQCGYKTMTQRENWSNTSILKILHNEKYCGDLVQKKTYTPNYLTHEKKYNHGEEDFVIIKNHHPPILSRERFEKAQQKLKIISSNHKNSRSGKYILSGKVFCAHCRSCCSARSKSRPDGSRYLAWKCLKASDLHPGHTEQIQDHVLTEIIQQIIGLLPINIQDVSTEICDIIKHCTKLENHTNNISSSFICNIINGHVYNEIFYKYIVKNIFVYDRSHIEIYLTNSSQTFDAYLTQ